MRGPMSKSLGRRALAPALGVALLSSSCGGGAREPEPSTTAGAEETPRATFSGTWSGRRFDATWAALAWQWPGGWTVILSDRAPREGETGLPVEATYVELPFGDTREPAETEPGHPVTPHVTVAPDPDGSTTPYEGEATATAVLTQVSMTGTFDPSGTTPQTVGSARLELDATFGADANRPSGRLAGRGEIPIVFLGAPHAACVAAGPAPTDFTWSDVPNLRAVPDAPVHGSAQGRAFEPASVYFERRATADGEEWSLVLTTATEPGTPGVDHETLTVRLDRAPRRGRITRAMASGGGYWQVCRGLGTTSWNADNAQAIEITRWQSGRCTPGEAGQPARLGTASGRMIVVYRGLEESENSWVAGTFTNVPVLTPSCD